MHGLGIHIGQLNVELPEGVLQFGHQELRFGDRSGVHMLHLSSEAAMKVMTFNIWNYTRPWNERRLMIAELIQRHRPQAVALQETRHDFRYRRGKGQGDQLAEMTGYHATVAVGQVYLPILRVDEAVTILTAEQPVSSVQRELTRLPRERADENQRVCVGVMMRINGRDVNIFNTHFSLSAG